MKLLLDTHTLLWWLNDDPKLAGEARKAIASPKSEIFYSPVSIWEVSIKKAAGKLKAPADFPDRVKDENFTELLIKSEHAWLAGLLPRHHDDPFDRMLVAQSKCEGFTLVTRDSWAARYGVAVLSA
ncbi:MAG: type II toxin-antitoxin system VapC family toxin [Candidatus Sumerlaeaceae bacterium]